MLAVLASPHGSASIQTDEATLSRELRTVGLLRPHVSVGYRWQNAGLRHLLTLAHNKCRHDFVSRSPKSRVGRRRGATGCSPFPSAPPQTGRATFAASCFPVTHARFLSGGRPAWIAS